MKLAVDLAAGRLTISGQAAQYAITNRVRTLRMGSRAKNKIDVVRTIPGNKPYDPQPFPKGLWNVTGVEWQKKFGFNANTYGPVKIRTDAWQKVRVWELDDEGNYLRESCEMAKDTGYLLHYSTSNTTLGCIRLASPQDAIDIANAIQAALNASEPVTLEVI